MKLAATERFTFERFNATIFTYGQTYLLAKHTILGNKTDPGLFQLVSNRIFQHVADQVEKRYLISKKPSYQTG
ncbi:unnamed protein product [Acanthoscelides obtectus]|uniref:Kinesin motor domain-containing protein n=1 Tax=Acanthoscelides obtectus TaxID=200917 RepID=A0A9P0P6Y4_ACAOB|nr:unnamed protein product [Acanthoscelides obtectus]CAK1666368.1 hypothetical protein AOBTE_LOCUS25276 [Acanthoscelides obtectus]